MTVVDVDINIFLAMIGIGIAIGAAVLGFSFKNTRCIARIEARLTNLENWSESHLLKTERHSEQITDLKSTIAVLQEKQRNQN